MNYLLICFLFAFSVAAPVTVTRFVDASPTGYDWQSDWVKVFPIDQSCNATEYNQLSAGLQEAQLLAEHAKDHTLRFGNKSPFFRKYFGNETASAEVVGHFDNVVGADKSSILFLCDDLDDKCKNDGWAGYWRGSNHSDETIICEYSFVSRRYLSQLCSSGYTVSQSKTNIFWASDLLHRFWHLKSIGQLVIDHYADTYKEVLELAQENSTYAAKNSQSLIYYALDVYAYDVAIPGEGCNGDGTLYKTSDFEIGQDNEHSSESGTSSTASSSDQHTDSNPSTTTSASLHCHTHADGEVHC